MFDRNIKEIINELQEKDLLPDTGKIIGGYEINLIRKER